MAAWGTTNNSVKRIIPGFTGRFGDLTGGRPPVDGPTDQRMSSRIAEGSNYTFGA